MYIKITVITNILFGIFFMNSGLLAGNAHERSLFVSSASISASQIAKCNLSNWSDLEPGVNNNVYSCAIGDNDGNLYVDSIFSIAGGVQAGKIAGWGSTIGIISNSGIIPEKYTLYEYYPNPSNPATKIKFDIPRSDLTILKIYNSLGQEVSRIVNEYLIPGTYEALFDAADLNSGIYFYSLHSGNFVQTKKMMLIN